MKINLVLAWYDFWVGIFWDRKKRDLYILPIPMIGIRIHFHKWKFIYTFAQTIFPYTHHWKYKCNICEEIKYTTWSKKHE